MAWDLYSSATLSSSPCTGPLTAPTGDGTYALQQNCNAFIVVEGTAALQGTGVHAYTDYVHAHGNYGYALLGRIDDLGANAGALSFPPASHCASLVQGKMLTIWWNRAIQYSTVSGEQARVVRLRHQSRWYTTSYVTRGGGTDYGTDMTHDMTSELRAQT
jgi:hypothetical protein